MSLNVFTFTGRLGADAELKFTQGGTAIWSARVAVDYGYGENKGTSWITAKSLGKHAEALGKLDLTKGTVLSGTGELQVREYDRKDGTKGTSVECLVNKIDLPSPKQESGERQQRQPAQRRDQAPAKPASFDDVPFDDDIPF